MLNQASLVNKDKVKISPRADWLLHASMTVKVLLLLDHIK